MEEKLKTAVIFIKYMNNLNDFVNSLNKKFLNWSKLFDKRLCNMLRSKNSSIGFLEKDCHLNNKNSLDILLGLRFKI